MPSPTLPDDYFTEPVSADTGLLAGEVRGTAPNGGLTARYLVERRHLEVAPHLERGSHPAGITANLMLRTEAWRDLGGFAEVRSGADLDLCWRAGEAGWKLSYRPAAAVEHAHEPGLRANLLRASRYGAGQAWLAKRHPAAGSPPRLARELARAIGGALVWTVTLRFRRGLYKVLDGLWATAYAWGYRWGTNLP